MGLWKRLKSSKLLRNLKEIWLRVKGQDPNLLAEIDGLLKKSEQHSDLIQRLKEELTRFRIENTELKAEIRKTDYLRQAVGDLERTKTELVAQIEKLSREIEEDRRMYEELKRIWIEFLITEKAARWKEKNRYQDDFIEFCRRVIPISEEEENEISRRAKELGAKRRRNSIASLFRRAEREPENTG